MNGVENSGDSCHDSNRKSSRSQTSDDSFYNEDKHNDDKIIDLPIKQNTSNKSFKSRKKTLQA